MNLNYAIFRSEPIMNTNDLSQIGSHNRREKKAYQSNPDIDITKSKDNIELVPLAEKYLKGFDNLTKEYKKEHEIRMKTEREDRKRTFKQMLDRSQNVVADELLFTATNEFFKDMTREDIKEWANTCMEFVYEDLGYTKEQVFTPLLKETNKEIEELKKYFNPKEKNFLLNDKSDILIEEKINKLGKLLEEKRDSKNQKIKFNSIKNKEIRDLTKEIKSNIFSKKETELYNDYQKFKTSLKEINKYFNEVAKKNHSKEVDDSFVKSKQKYLDNYVLNAIINYARYKKITDSKIIQEAVYKEYKKNKKRDKFDILTSYLSSNNRKSQFVSKYKIKEAVRNINDELEQAEKEFENLFKEDKEHVCK